MCKYIDQKKHFIQFFIYSGQTADVRHRKYIVTIYY